MPSRGGRRKTSSREGARSAPVEVESKTSSRRASSDENGQRFDLASLRSLIELLAPTNITHLNNSRIDKLLEQGRQTFDQQARKQIYYDFQKYLLEESPAIFIKFPTTYNISRLK